MDAQDDPPGWEVWARLSYRGATIAEASVLWNLSSGHAARPRTNQAHDQEIRLQECIRLLIGPPPVSFLGTVDPRVPALTLDAGPCNPQARTKGTGYRENCITLELTKRYSSSRLLAALANSGGAPNAPDAGRKSALDRARAGI